ncbi:uncharacterized protein MONBRDRAFT_6365 [Monosiga brevicollis MX1]|uniref:Uncharacterized protein n=1 Tax=Monosiga brevicollis TaxID=81824 RepID=A9UTM5_MONBE|nr:uncharacterized protein MONBRDRAFT_6365 [Monosiga brevicollis MX1]EDQ91520.1 predicted protein [Monosiga brevicollis MX1]|eukprot:XP_001743942.1 hypothetical protein [Monosiga brevicollis MX1]
MDEFLETTELGTSMHLYENRVSSFGDLWPLSRRRKCNPKNLAKTGFYHTGNVNSPDATVCFMCDKELADWDPKDDPSKEHRKHAPACPFLNLDLAESRRATFKCWKEGILDATVEQSVRAARDAEAARETTPEPSEAEASASADDDATEFSNKLNDMEEGSNKLAQKAEEDTRATPTKSPANEVDTVQRSAKTIARAKRDTPSTQSEPAVQSEDVQDSTKSARAGSQPTAKKLDAPDVQDMTMAEFFDAKKAEKLHAIVQAGEARLAAFRAAAADTRAQLVAMLA